MPLRPLVTKKVVNVGGRAKARNDYNQEIEGNRMVQFVHWYHQLPGAPLLKKILSVT